MAKDGLLGKKLVISLVDETGSTVYADAAKTKPLPTLEILKWSVEEITNEEKKYPIGEEAEYREVIQNGWKGTIEGQSVSTAYDDIVDLKNDYQEANGGTLRFAINTTETYKDGTVRKYKYEGVTFDGYKRNSDGNNKPVTNNLGWHSPKRSKVS